MKPDRTSTQRGRGADKEVKRKRERHPAEQQLYSHIRAQSYHRQHLLDLLKQAIDEQDHNRAAVAAVVMLAAQDPSYVPGPDMLREARTSQYFPDIAAAALEVLRDQVSTEELKRYMRKLHDHQINPEQAELVTFELVYLLAERGSYQEAYDVLDSSYEKSKQQFQRAAVCGFLRHAQVSELLEKTGKQQAFGHPGHSDAPGSNMFQHEEQVWSKGGQQLQEFWHGAEAHLKVALRLQPEAVAEGCLLAQLYMMAGLPEDALETARALRLNAPADADSHALFILMKESEGMMAESVPELAQAYVDMLHCDPASQYAVQGLLGLHARLPVSPAVLLEAAALHLDVADEHSPSAKQAWTALADTLSNAAKLLCNLQAKESSAQGMAGEDNQAAVPACAPQQQGEQFGEQHGTAHDQQHEELFPSTNAHDARGQTPDITGQADGQSSGTEGQAERQPPGTEGQADRGPQRNESRDQQSSRSEGSEQEAAWAIWQAFRDLLPVQRYWWVKLHFRWRESSATPDPLDSPDDPDRMAVLRAKAITAALMYDDDSNVGSESTRTAFVPKVQDHFEAAGEFGIAQDIDDAVELGASIRKAILIMKQAEQVPGMPFDTPRAEFGLVSSLPPVWWSLFPFKRREHQQKHQ